MSYLYYDGFGTIRNKIIVPESYVFYKKWVVEYNMMRIEPQSSSLVQLFYYLLRAWIK